MGEDLGEGDIPLTLTLSRQRREYYDVAICKKDVRLLRPDKSRLSTTFCQSLFYDIVSDSNQGS
jgi:hypothetical protein